MGLAGAGEGLAGVGERPAGVGHSSAGVGQSSAGVGQRRRVIGRCRQVVGRCRSVVGRYRPVDGGSVFRDAGGLAFVVSLCRDERGERSEEDHPLLSARQDLLVHRGLTLLFLQLFPPLPRQFILELAVAWVPAVFRPPWRGCQPFSDLPR